MKTLLSILIIVIGFISCKKTSRTLPEPETQTRFPAPQWKTDQTGKYPASMTAVVRLPEKLKTDQLEGDRLAAFIDEECRGEGIAISMDSLKVFFVLVNGVASEQSQLKFRYYSAKTSFLYQTKNVANFKVDDIYGTAEKPMVLELVPVK